MHIEILKIYICQ